MPHSALSPARLLLGILLAGSTAFADPVTVKNVPAYNWYHGCTPTATGSILGYWDLHGYPQLFDASGAAVYLTSNVQDQISSPAHNAKYDPVPDNFGPVPPQTSLADFLFTSVGGLAFGSTYLSEIASGVTGYASYRGYQFAVQEQFFSLGMWSSFRTEIDHNRPVLFDVDSNGDGVIDHSVNALGYEDRGAGGLWFGMYDTFSEAETIRWEPFRGTSPEYAWGIYDQFTVTPVTPPVPEPAGVVLLGTAAAAAWLLQRKRRKN